MKLLYLFSCILVIAGCVTTKQYAKFPDQENEAIELANSRIYVIRPSLLGYWIPSTIKNNEVIIGELNSGGFLSFETSDSEMELKVELENWGVLSSKIDLSKKDNYFFLLDSSFGFISGIDMLKQISKNEAIIELEKTTSPDNVSIDNYWFDYGKAEPWYIQSSIGVFAKSRFYGKAREVENMLKIETGSNQSSGEIEMIGVYFPVMDNRTLFGIQLAGGGWDYYDEEWFSRFRNSFSIMHFYSNRAASGFFVRGDFGISSLSLVNEKTNITFSEEKGTNYLLGVGYAVRFQDSSLILGLNSEMGFYSSSKVNTTFFNLGWLW